MAAIAALASAIAACGSSGEGFGDAGQRESGAVSPGEGGTEAGAADEGAPDTGAVTSADGFGASRTACIEKINALRATDTAVALKPLTLINTTSTNACVDRQATNDQAHDIPHYSFIENDPACKWGFPRASAQDECVIGYGTSPAGTEKCLQDMWDERLKPHCKGCVGCTAFAGACPDCDYSGSLGYECGHYVNMSAPYFSSVACGFAGAAPESSGGWSVQDFE